MQDNELTADWKRAREIFEAALDLPPSEREAFARDRCGSEDTLFAVVLQLLDADRTVDGFLEGGGSLVALPAGTPGLQVGAQVGPFELVRVIASGGMGTVYEAQQENPRRPVALKTLRAGYWGGDQVRRFQAEARILGVLQHPGIAQVFEAGTSDIDGMAVPYFAMELVPNARTLVEYAEEHDLDLRARLKLFQGVCEAVHYGHTKGVIHRDLKPGNVLVDGEGRVKVIDFGLARVIDHDASSLSLTMVETQDGHVLGTLAYMSPEHLSGQSFAVDVRSDVYSLGCMLHELLAGSTPVDVSGLTIPAAIARVERGDLQVSKALPRDLRCVVLRALEHGPKQRYASASEFGADLGRFLRHESVAAGAFSKTTALLRFFRRNRTPLAFGLGTIAALVIGLVRSEFALARESAALQRMSDALDAESVALAQERAARERAESERQMMEKVGFVLGFFIDAMNPLTGGRDARIIDVIEKDVVTKLPYTRDPRVRTYLETWIGEGYLHLREFEPAAEYLEAAWAGAQKHFEEESAYRLQAAAAYADLLERTGRVQESADLSRRALPIAERVFGEFHNRAAYLRFNLAICLRNLGQPGEAEALMRKDLAHYEGDKPGTQVAMRKTIAGLIAAQGRLDEAARWYAEAIGFAEREFGADSVMRATARMGLSGVRLAQGDVEAAEELLSLARPVLEAGGESPQNRYSLECLWTRCLLGQGRAQEAELALGELEKALDSYPHEPGDMEVQVAALRAELARQLEDPDAPAIAQQALQLAGELTPGEPAHRVAAELVLARLEIERQAFEGALGRMRSLERDLEGGGQFLGEGERPILEVQALALEGLGRGAELAEVRARLGR